MNLPSQPPSLPKTPALSLPPAAEALALTLHRALRGRWASLPGEVEALAVPDYRAAAVPADLVGRRAELIVEASDLAALDAAFTSDADALVIDFDDTFAPTPGNVQAAYDALPRAAASGKPLLARPRALYAVEEHLDFGGPAIAALCGRGGHSLSPPGAAHSPLHPEARNAGRGAVLGRRAEPGRGRAGPFAQRHRVCLQIETFLAVQHADALLHTLRGRAFGLNAGRWDYVFSLIKTVGRRRGAVPPRSELTMDVDAMRAYAEALVRVAQRRGAEAIGGSAAVAPDPADPQPALDTGAGRQGA